MLPSRSSLFATLGVEFGDYCSPISDRSIMSSISAASDHIDHVKIQISYALTVALVAVVVGYLPAAVLGINPLISLLAGYGLAYLMIRYIEKPVEEAMIKKHKKVA